MALELTKVFLEVIIANGFDKNALKLLKTKKQITPGFEDRDFTNAINENNLIKNFKDFYASKGTERSLEIIYTKMNLYRLLKPDTDLFNNENMINKTKINF